MTTAFAELPWTVDPDALKSFLAVTSAVAHPLTNGETWPCAEREGEHVSPFLARTPVQASAPTSFPIELGVGGARHTVEYPGVTLQGVQREGAGR